MLVRTLQGTDAQAYQELRLHGLKTNPDAFGSTYERESQFPIATVMERIQPTCDKFVLGAFDDKGNLVGIVTFVRESGFKTSHKGNVYGMYVREEARGQGVGRHLMIELLKRAKEMAGVERINLAVVSNNEPAKNLYAAVGFQAYGLERQALKVNDRYWDEDLMVLEL